MSYEVFARNAFLLAELEEISRLAEEKKIPFIALKGAALFLRGVFTPEERAVSDVDLLVRPKDKPAFIALLAEIGYARLKGVSQSYWKGPAVIDLHTGLWHAGEDWIWRDAEKINGVLVPSLEAAALHCAAHSLLYEGCFSDRARNDFSKITGASGFSWTAFLSKTRELGLEPLACAVLGEMKSPLPPEISAGLEPGGGLTAMLFKKAAAKRESSGALEFFLPVFFRPKLALEAFFPDEDTLIDRFGDASLFSRLRRPFQLLRSAAAKMLGG